MRLVEYMEWNGFPLRSDIGEQPSQYDTPPEKTSDGDFVLYHGTSLDSANEIVKTKTIKPDDIGRVGVGTIPDAVETFACLKKMKTGAGAILWMVIDKDWLINQRIYHEGGGHHSAFLLQGPRGQKAIIPPIAIKRIKIWRKF